MPAYQTPLIQFIQRYGAIYHYSGLLYKVFIGLISLLVIYIALRIAQRFIKDNVLELSATKANKTWLTVFLGFFLLSFGIHSSLDYAFNHSVDHTVQSFLNTTQGLLDTYPDDPGYLSNERFQFKEEMDYVAEFTKESGFSDHRRAFEDKVRIGLTKSDAIR